MDTPEDPCTHVLTKVRSPFLEVMPMIMVHYSTTLRQTAMVWLALLMILRKSLRALFAQSEVNPQNLTHDQLCHRYVDSVASIVVYVGSFDLPSL